MGFLRTYTVRDDVGVTRQAALGVTVGLLVAGKVPDDQVLVATAREQHVGAKLQSKKRSQVRTDFSQIFLTYFHIILKDHLFLYHFFFFFFRMPFFSQFGISLTSPKR